MAQRRKINLHPSVQGVGRDSPPLLIRVSTTKSRDKVQISETGERKRKQRGRGSKCGMEKKKQERLQSREWKCTRSDQQLLQAFHHAVRENIIPRANRQGDAAVRGQTNMQKDGTLFLFNNLPIPDAL